MKTSRPTSSRAIPSTTPAFRHGRMAGFTLIEMLIVVTIIGVLATLVFVLAGRMKMSALKTRELSNMRTITQLIMVYHGDANMLPGPLNRGVRMPSKVAEPSRANYLSTFLIDGDYLGEDDEVWKTTASGSGMNPETSFVLNSTLNSAPTYFFGRIQGTRLNPKPVAALQSNIKPSMGGKSNQDPGSIWLLSTADRENYGASDLISMPSETQSAWEGRFYTFIDGRVEFFRRQSPPSYPSSVKAQ